MLRANEEISNAVGQLYSSKVSRPFALSRPFGSSEPSDARQRFALIEDDVRKLYDGLMLASRKIADLEARLGPE